MEENNTVTHTYEWDREFHNAQMNALVPLHCVEPDVEVMEKVIHLHLADVTRRSMDAISVRIQMWGEWRIKVFVAGPEDIMEVIEDEVESEFLHFMAIRYYLDLMGYELVSHEPDEDQIEKHTFLRRMSLKPHLRPFPTTKSGFWPEFND